MAESGYESMDPELSDKCREFCGENNDCFGEVFELNEIRGGGKKGIFTLVFLLPTIPSLLFTHWPKIRFEEFLCFIGSIFSLWFGFSIVMLSDVCLLVVRQVKKIINFRLNIILNNNNNNFVINNSFEMNKISNTSLQRKKRLIKNLF
jgi:hypothetical protein